LDERAAGDTEEQEGEDRRQRDRRCPVHPAPQGEVTRMVHDASTQRRSWEREYANPNPLWKGPSRDELPSLEGKRVLELGCGNGKTAAALVRTAEETVAVDFSRRGLEACRRALTAPNLLLVEADVRNLPFADASFDLVVAFHVLGHLLEDDRCLAVEEVHRVLRPRGELLIRVFSANDMRCGSGEPIEPGTYVKGTGIPCHYFSGAELSELFRDFHPMALDEERAEKRYNGAVRLRAEWVGAYTRP
jgi:SAM-dependent methyltransferase